MKRNLFFITVLLILSSVLFAQGVTDPNPVKPLDSIKEVAPVPVKAAGFTMHAEDPYRPPVWGLGHDLVANGARYSVFVPESQHPWKPGVIILTPNGTTAKAFALSTLGRQWMAAAETYEFNLGFMEPAHGAEWNISGDPALRNELKAVEDVYTQMRSKSQNLSVPFTMDKSRVSLVGYEEGAVIALIGAAGSPAAFAGVAAIDSTAVDYTYLQAVGDDYCFPFPADGMKAKAEIGLVSNTLPMPAWFINSKDNGALEYFKTINKAVPSYSNELAAVFANPANPVERVWVANSSDFALPALLWNEFLSKNTRPLGVEGGHLGYAMDFSERKDGTGYVYTEEMVDGFLRKWMTYVPASYDASTPAPLVTVLHGYTATMYALAEESRWSDVAEENGAIVVFAQAYPNVLPSFPNIPAPAWISANLFAGDETSTDDVAFLTHVIDSTQKQYNIDTARVYGTGHSNGCAMILALASLKPELYTAIAPIGSASPGVSDTLESLIPTWIFIGQFDGTGYEIEEGNRIDTTLDYWTRVNKLDRDAYTTETSENGRFTTLSWNSETGAPVVRFSKVNRSAHSYFPEESWKIWNEFFSRYTRDASGTVVFTK
ncbi:MAG: PHB depolymerase family esterase [Sphaerochaeta sp.]|nr:PHB depolymerase family esterase [Sphaerochaeta sp.]